MPGRSWFASQRLIFALLGLFFAFLSVKSEPTARTREDDATLVVYSYRHADPEALNNLQYFVTTVIKPHDPARYIILVDHAMQQHGHMSSQGLPKLPSNAEYLTIRDCFELGHVGKVLLGEKSPVHVSVSQYKFFVWLDSSAKGALLPSHTVQGDRAPAWHTLLTSRITTTTKLVGANIVCQPVREDFVPHVEATLMATDTIGLEVLQKAKCFDCYATWHEAKMKGEMAASAAMLEAGYNLDCINPPYQGVNWRDKSQWPCAKTVRQHPQEESAALGHVQKFRTQGGEGFEAQQPEGTQEELSEAAQIQHGIDDQQKVSDSLLEAGFVKPMQHEDPDADPQQTARIGGRLVESGFGRLQFEDAMEHDRQSKEQATEGIDGAESLQELEQIIQPAHLVHSESTQPESNSHAAPHVTDLESIKHTAIPQTDLEAHDIPATGAENRVTEGNGAVDIVEPGITQEAELEEELVSELCPEVELEPAPRSGLHVQNEALQLSAEVAELDHDKGVDLVFYGDSIAELWRIGGPATGGRSNVFWHHFGTYTSSILAVGGDQSAHLWWRLLHGQVFHQHPPQLSIVNIGANDLEVAGECGTRFIADVAGGVIERITHLVRHLQQVNPDTVILLVGIIPLAEVYSPDEEGQFQWPNKFSESIAQINEALQAIAAQHNLVHYLDCGEDMLTRGQIIEDVYPDGVHPSSEGMTRLAQCLSPSITRFAQHHAEPVAT